MTRRVNLGVRAVAAAALATLFLKPLPAAAQTTVVLDAPDTEVTDSYIRGGSYANTVHNTDALATKANASTGIVRRALLKFDTETRIPRGATVSSAKLTLTLKRSDPETRRIGVYRVTNSFQESQATWYTRKAGYRWTSAGGDLSSKLTEFSIGTRVGTRVTIDVTSLVQSTVRGTYGSRYTRIALVDTGSSSNTSYKEFYSSEASTASNRPVLTVVYGGSSSTPPPPPPSGSSSRIRLLDWNVHYSGMGTDGKFDPNRIVDYIVKFNPDIISLNEVTRYAYYDTSRDYSVYFTQQLKSKTGRPWYSYFRTDSGASKGVGNMVLSRFPIASTSYCQLSSRRVAVKAAVYVNGRLLNVWSTHLDSSSGNSMRITEVKNLKSCLAGYAEQKIVAGDFNASSSTTEIALMKQLYYDAWAEAAADRTAISYAGNTGFGSTRNGRIDYVFFSRAATALVLRSAQVYDTRNAYGRMPSDHKPLLVTFDVR